MRTIPDTVGGFDLSIPFSQDLFNVKPGGLPNGDPSLEITDPTSPNWVAFYQGVDPNDCPVPNFSTQAAALLLSWSVNFWLKCPLMALTGKWFLRFGDPTTTNSGNNYVWVFPTITSSANINYSERFVGTQSITRTANVWSMLTVVHDGPGNSRKVYRDANLINDSTIGAGGLTAVTEPKFSIGANNAGLSDPVSPTTVLGPIEMGKLALWGNKALTQAEITSMHEAMYL